MSGTIIFGYGTVGSAVTKLLLERGDAVRVAQRTQPADLPSSATYTACDIL